MTDADSMYDEGGYHFEIEAGWDDSDYRCQWCVISSLMNEDDYGRIAGVAAGCLPSGDFEVERFYLEIGDDGKATKLIVESGYDVIKDPNREGAGIGFWGEVMSSEVQEAAEAAYTLLFRWNDDEAWDNDDEILLREDKADEPDLERVDDMLRIRTDAEPYPRWICEAVMLKSVPYFEDDD